MAKKTKAPKAPKPAELLAESFVGVLNALVDYYKSAGYNTLHHDFGYTVGQKMCRVYWSSHPGMRSSVCFIEADGRVRRADGWKQAGYYIGHVADHNTQIGCLSLISKAR